ncbi:hypothetical protein [Deinococcus roseus]|uniref:Uncharacterized protein n=1 Tax=Deinococcus roseus TaxID=392414 RepID=A0ABQ2D3A6_9DEIO|nr:hypothetical protein [Deinococcus roseus]GGJ44180.1 hypothetical protein GCM10008938_33060 [Deinococcus roseus]
MPGSNSDLSDTIHLSHAWESLFGQCFRENRIADLKSSLLKWLHDPVARVRYARCLHSENAPIQDIEHYLQDNTPLSQAYLLFIRSKSTNFQHHRRIVEDFVGSPSAPIRPHSVLFQSPAATSTDIEACMYLYYSVGISLLFVNRVTEGRSYLQQAQDLAEVLGMTMTSLISELNVGLSRFIEGDYLNALESSTRVVKGIEKFKVDSINLEKVKAHEVWLAYITGSKFEAYANDIADLSSWGMFKQLLNAFYDQDIKVPNEVDPFPLTQLLYYLKRARDLGYALRLLDKAMIEEACQLILDLPPPTTDDDFIFLTALWIKAYAFSHCGMPEEAIAYVEGHLNLSIINHSEAARILRGIVLLQSQLMLGDQQVLPGVKTAIHTVTSYLEKQPKLIRERVITLIARGMPNVHYLLLRTGANLPELEEYLHRECLLVQSTQATFRGEVVSGYPLMLGSTYTDLFVDDSAHNREVVHSRLSRHQEVVKQLGVNRLPGLIFEPAVNATMVVLRDAGVLDSSCV